MLITSPVVKKELCAILSSDEIMEIGLYKVPKGFTEILKEYDLSMLPISLAKHDPIIIILFLYESLSAGSVIFTFVISSISQIV